MRKLIICLLLLFAVSLLLSCDPGFNIVVQNDSSHPVTVKVLNDNANVTRYDSIHITNKITTDFTGHKAIAITKHSDNAYTFVLKESCSAQVDFGMGSPDYKQKIIINSKDTLTFDSSEYHKEGGFMSKSHVFLIKK